LAESYSKAFSYLTNFIKDDKIKFFLKQTAMDLAQLPKAGQQPSIAGIVKTNEVICTEVNRTKAKILELQKMICK
jgi:hypothetical protein